MAARSTLLARIGGDDALKAAVEGFYERLVHDAALAHFFEGTDLKFLKRHQVNFMRIAFTGIPPGMDVPKLIKDKHTQLFARGLDETHFDLVAGHLVAQLQSMGVAAPLVEEVVEVVGPLRSVFEQGALEQRIAKRQQWMAYAGYATAGLALAALVAVRRTAP